MQEDVAIDRANGLLRHIIEHQPGLIHPQTPNTLHGAKAAEFLEALRQGLIEMFKKDPD